MSLAENLKRLRIEQQYSQAELAKLVGVSQQTISCIEQGIKTKPKYETVMKLANKFGITAEELVDGQTA